MTDLAKPAADDDQVSITEEWLRDAGFRWHQFDRQPHKHWTLWLGDSAGQGRMTSFEDIGIEVSPSWWLNRNGEKIGPDEWHCWLRSDAAGRYHRFIHLRHLTDRAQLRALVEAISGQSWDPGNHLYGSLRTPEQAERIRQENKRLDRKLMLSGHPWSDVEKDPTRGRALPEHLEAHAKAAGSA